MFPKRYPRPSPVTFPHSALRTPRFFRLSAFGIRISHEKLPMEVPEGPPRLRCGISSIIGPRRGNGAFGLRPSAFGFWALTLMLRSLFSPATAAAQDTQTESTPSAPTSPSTYAPAPTTQYAPASASGYPSMTPATAFAGTSQLSVAAPASPQDFLASTLLQWGPVNLHPHLAYDVSYGNNLQPSQGQRANTLINTVSPGLLASLGDRWSLDYTPTLRFYSSHSFQDSLDQTVNLSGGTTYKDWSFGLSQGFASTSQALIETGSQTDQQTFTTALNAAYQMGSKMSLDLSASQNFRYVSQGSIAQPVANTRDWSTMEWLNYQFIPRFSLGLGVGFTYDNLSFGPDITSEQYQGRINWHATDKLSFALSGGLDDRQFLASSAPNLLSPIFSASVQYPLFETTSLSLAANRSVSPSYFAGAVTDGTTISAGLHQRLLRKLYLDVSGGYGTTTYINTTTVFGPANTGNYASTSLSIRLSTTFLKRATAALYFQENMISSSSTATTSALYNYTTKQTGLSLGYRF
jgi:hypothetical protein